MPPTSSRESVAPRSLLAAAALPCALLFGAMLNLTLVVPSLKELVLDELGGTVTHGALFFTVEMVAYLVFAPVWGALSDRSGRRRPFIVGGYAAAGVVYLGYLGIDSIPVLLSLRFVQGAAAIAGWSTTLARVFDGAPESSRQRLAGLAGASLILGVGVGAPIGGALASAWGPRAPLAVAGGLFLLQALAALALPDRASARERPRLREIARELARRPRLLLPWGLYFVERFTVGMFVVVFPLFLAATRGADPAARGRALALFLLPFAVCQLGTYRLTRRFGALPVLAGGTVLYGLALSALARSGPGELAPLLIALGALAAVIFPPTLALTAEWTAPATRASAIAGFNLAGSLGFALGPLAGAWAESRGGFTLAFDVAAAATLAAAAAVLVAIASGRWR